MHAVKNKNKNHWSFTRMNKMNRPLKNSTFQKMKRSWITWLKEWWIEFKFNHLFSSKSSNISVILPLLGHVTLFGTLYLSGTPNSLSPLWDQGQLSLVLGDSNPWRGSNKYFGSLTQSIHLTIYWLLRKEWLERLLSNSYVFKTDLGSILPQDMTLKDHDFSDWVFWF